jgi:hypothetical protein
MPFEIDENKLSEGLREPKVWWHKKILKTSNTKEVDDQKMSSLDKIFDKFLLWIAYSFVVVLMLAIIVLVLGVIFYILRFSWNLFN